jgi:hypothetical protein
VHAAVWTLAVWTLVVWAGRIRNALDADDGAGAVVLAATFVALAVAVLATRGRRPVVLALAGWTVAVWAVRIVDIALLSDHDAGFVVVHAVLAAVSVAVAAWATRGRTVRALEPTRS